MYESRIKKAIQQIQLYNELYDSGNENVDIPSKKYIVMEKIEKDSSIKNLTPYIDIIYELYIFLCDNGIWLDDLHFHNIIISTDGKIYLIDFGNVKIFDRGVNEDLRISKEKLLKDCKYFRI